jgi:hypothetical protein
MAWGGPATGRNFCRAVGAAERGELLGRLADDQCLETHADEFGFLADASETGGGGERFFVDIQRLPQASFSAQSNAVVKSDPDVSGADFTRAKPSWPSPACDPPVRSEPAHASRFL